MKIHNENNNDKLLIIIDHLNVAAFLGGANFNYFKGKVHIFSSLS